MSRGPKPDRPVITIRILALLCVLLALMCAGLAWTWTQERARSACWRTAAEFQLLPEGACE